MQSFNQNVIKHKTALLNLAAELGNISQACRIMGFARDTFYRYQTARDSGGIEALFDANRRKPNLKNRVSTHTNSLDCRLASKTDLLFQKSMGIQFEWDPVKEASNFKKHGLSFELAS